MSKSIEELELKFSILDTKIENKINFVKNLHLDQQGFLNEHFDSNCLTEKYSIGLNNWRQSLLEQIWDNLESEIEHVNELVRIYGYTEKIRIHLETARRLNSHRSVTKSKPACIVKLIVKEFKFRSKFSASQLIKYKRVLGISEYLVPRGGICDWDESLIKACRKPTQNLEIVRLMIDGGANVNAIDRKEKTALIFASENGDLETVKFLVEHDAHINTTNKYTSLKQASRYNRLEIVTFLVENGAHINAKGGHCDETALMIASQNGHENLVKFLFEKGGDLHARDINNHNVLMFAAQNGHKDVVKFIFEKGGDLNARDINNRTALMLAAQFRKLNIVKYLLEIGADFNSTDKNRALQDACCGSLFEIVKYLVENGADVNANDDEFFTPLINACDSGIGRLNIVEYLVNNGADINAKNKYNNTALMCAARKGDEVIVKYLFEKGADLNSKNIDNSNALMLASENGELSTVEYLIEVGAEFNSTD